MPQDVDQKRVLSEVYRSQDALVAYAFMILRDWGLAQDVVQESVVAANGRWREFRAGEAVFPWLKRVTRNKAVDAIRKRKRLMYVEDADLLALVDAQFDRRFEEDRVEEAMGRQREALQVCMDKLESKALALLLGFYRDRQSCEKLASVYGKSVNAVRLSISRIRALLRECAEKQVQVLEQV